MAVKKLKEYKQWDDRRYMDNGNVIVDVGDRQFADGVKIYVNGKKLPIVDGDGVDEVARKLADECRKTRGLADFFANYLNSLGGDSDFSTDDIDALCYWFATEMMYDYIDSEPGEFYIGDGYSGVNFEAFDGAEVSESVTKKVTPKRIKKEARAVNGRPRALSPQYDSRKSFYNKAHVVDDNDGNSTLYSYNTPVCRIVGDKVELLPKWDYSATTLRHVKDFLQQNGFEAGSKAQIAKKYSVVAESKRRASKSRVNEDYDDPSWEDIAEDPYMDYEGLDDVKRALETAANDADDIRYYLETAWKAFDNNYEAAIEMFSGPNDAYAAAEALNEIKGLLAQAYKLIPDEVVNLANDSYGMYD